MDFPNLVSFPQPCTHGVYKFVVWILLESGQVIAPITVQAKSTKSLLHHHFIKVPVHT